jgi:hypothetical protein
MNPLSTVLEIVFSSRQSCISLRIVSLVKHDYFLQPPKQNETQKGHVSWQNWGFNWVGFFPDPMEVHGIILWDGM